MATPSAPDTATRQRAGEIVVWWAWCSRARPLTTSVLSVPERERVAGLHLEADRERSALARVVLRRALAQRLGQPPESFGIDWSQGPALAPNLGLWASVSHSHDGVAVALSSAGPLGVDIEAIERTRDIDHHVRRRVFTPNERSALDALGDDAAERAALELWTVKEAVLKASGDRLTHAPATVEIDGSPSVPRLVRFDDRPELVDGAVLRAIAPPESGDPGYVGTVAVLGAAHVANVNVVARDAAELFR